MNKIKINGVKNILATNNSVEIKTDFKYHDKLIDIIILSEDDILNDNKLIKLRGYMIGCLIIPMKFKYILKDQKSYEILKPSISDKTIITYY